MENLLFPVDEVNKVEEGPVTCLGITFNSDTERREYFRNELRKKLPELKSIEGFPNGEDEDIIALSDPPYYTACPNPWINDFINQWEEEKKELQAAGKRTESFEVKEPYASDVSEGKNNPIYNAHSYHTKVPHPAIMRYILHYTQPGDIIYDGFCGTGMTGVAAGYCERPDSESRVKIENEFKELTLPRPKWGKRHAILNDLSPIATFIGLNNNNNSFKSSLVEFDKILEEARNKFSYLYKTRHSNGDHGNIEYVVWSDVVICENCGNEELFFNLFVKKGEGIIENIAFCPHCKSEIIRSKSQKKHISTYDDKLDKVVNLVEMKPVFISYKYNGKRYVKSPDIEDFRIINEINNYKIHDWFPSYELGKGDKMLDPNGKGIYHIHQFYFKRTLIILSYLWNKSSLFSKRFITNSISRNLTKLNRYIVNKHNPNGRINGPLSGTYYVPSEVVEQNVFEILAYKKSDSILNNFKNVLQIGSATDTSTIPSESVDYVFTDPPFGANIMYSELNSISEAWLKVRTNNKMEAIENKTQGKTIDSYRDLMSNSLLEYYRILKPGRWMTIEFSNTSAAVWNSIQYAIAKAGFVVANVSALDKVHGGIKSMRYTTSVKQDLVISCYKPTDELTEKFKASPDTATNSWDFIEELLEHLPVHLLKENSTTAVIERSPKILFDRLISYYVQHGYAVPMNAAEFQKGLKERFVERDGMYFTAEQAIEYEDKKKETTSFVSLALLVGSEAEGIEWLKRKLEKEPLTYSDILPDWMQDLVTPKKGDKLPELMQILEENFLKDENGCWHIPDINDQAQKEAMKTKRLMKEFAVYVEAKKVKEARLEALRCGFKECYKNKDFATIVAVGNKLPEELLMTDEVLLQYYDIASSRV